MMIECDENNPPLGGILAAEIYKSQANNVVVKWGRKSVATLTGASAPITFRTSNDLIRLLDRTFSKQNLSGLEKVTFDHWLTFSLSLEAELPVSVEYLDKTLSPLTYLVGEYLSGADLAVFSVLHVSSKFAQISAANPLKNVQRWMRLISAQPAVAKALQELPKEVIKKLRDTESKDNNTRKPVRGDASVGRQQEGKFVELPGAEMGKVVVRFPPEASGYLHIGHAKAALLNQYYQEAFQGKLIMRFDDTNPAKENVHFEKVILEDVALLQLRPDLFTHTSQYFELMLSMCERLLRERKAFVDDTPPEQMKAEREQRVESKNRDNSVERNLQLWEEMKTGSETGVRCCVRARMFMDSPNGCMRDPTIYRCKPEPHPRTGTHYKVYPTYDFACPIVDSIEGVTHVLRTMEYHDRDDQFFWFIEALGLRRPHIWEYSRLSMTNTVLSKRKLTWFVEQGLVDGWDDPRMPTVRGVLRRGMTVEGLRQFITAQGSSRSVVFMEWDKIWAINKKVIDPIAPRYTALESEPVAVRLQGASESSLCVPLHPKSPDVGTKTVWVAPRLLIDQADAKALKEGENATFINYGNVMINKIHRTADGTVTAVDGTPNLDNKDYKKTLKLTWLADSEQAPPTEAYCVYFDHIISKPLLGKDEDFKQYIGHQTRWEVPMVGEPALANVKAGDIIQLQRRGFFRVDVAPAPRSPLSGRVQPAVLFHIPDGSAKDAPGQSKPAAAAAAVPLTAAVESVAGTKPEAAVAAAAHQQVALQGELVRTLKASKAEKSKLDEAVKLLLGLKAKYKETTGQEWKPDALPAACAAAVSPSPSPAAASAGSRAGELLREIAAQGDNVRALKSKKAEKAAVELEVKKLLALKAEYKSATGSDWTPDAKPPAAPSSAALSASAPAAPAAAAPVAPSSAAAAAAAVAAQGEKVRALKEQKADKVTVQAQVKQLLALKAEYKALTGAEWTPAAAAAPAAAPSASASAAPAAAAAAPAAAQLSARIAAQGRTVRTLKEQKADKAAVQAEVHTLLALKAEFKIATGKDWTPSMEEIPAAKAAAPPAATAAPITSGGSGDELAARVTEQGNLVRDLKAKKADKASVEEAVKKLLELKAEYQAATGAAYVAPPGGGAAPAKPRDAKPKEAKPKEAKPKESKPKESKPKEKKENKPKEPAKPPKGEPSSGVKKVSRLGLEASKDTDLSEWYSQVITKAEMIEYYDISGCYILRPWSFAIWEAIRDFLSTEFKKLGVKDCYFPIFVSKAVLEREKTHIADFAPEVAWVTHSGSSELAEHIAVRPTSETVMYPAYAKWIQSHRDLPLRLNQWNNVVRWEFKQPQPFIRTREFLWQEGHTAFLTREEADAEVLIILELYARVYEELLAIPVVRGRKSEKEKFAGGDYTTTVEGYVPASGRGIQGATSHHLGQNFAKMFDIVYDDPETQEKKYVYQNSWGMTTRTIGVMVLVHGDDRGLVLPPRVASVQVIVVPCGIKADSTAEERAALADSCRQLERELVAAGVRAEGDYRDNYSPGWKYNHWELKGVPIRVELGPKELSRGEVVAVRRLDGGSSTFKRDSAPDDIKALLERTHDEMLAKATAERDSCTTVTTHWAEFTAGLDKKHVLLAPFCGEISCEDNIKNDSARQEEDVAAGAPAMGAKSLCIPFQQPRALAPTDSCIHPACQHAPKFFGLFGRSY